MADKDRERAPPPAHLVARFKAAGPKRILALDGGGVRGVITLAFLAKIEAELRARFKRPDLVLADYFDLIGGTSVGALIGTMLAIGHTVESVENAFLDAMPKIFKRRWWRGLPILARFDARRVSETVAGIVGRDTILGTNELRTGLVIVAKRLDTGSVWTMTNVPSYPYYAANKDYRLVDILRASTAASMYFKPQTMIVRSLTDPTKNIKGVFVDGAASPHNNPALLLYMMAGLKRFNFGGPTPYDEENHASWQLGEDNIFMVSVGTGGSPHMAGERWAAMFDGIDALKGVMSDGQELVLSMMQWLSHTKADDGWRINAVMRNFEHDVLGAAEGLDKPLLHFRRYDAPLENKWLIGKKLTDNDSGFSEARLSQLRDFVDPIDTLRRARLGRDAAAQQVKAAHFDARFDHIWTPTS